MRARLALLPLLATLGFSGCREVLTVATADCPGALSVRDVPCEETCRADSEATVFAQDTEACRFVRWEGSCGTSPLCRASETGGRAIFERIAWPLTVDLSAAPNFTATVTPSGRRCEATCEVWLPVGADFSVQAVGPVGQKPGFSGDCASIGDTCSGIADRARTVSVRTEGDDVSLRLVSIGDGVVTLEAPATTCGANETCVAKVTRGSTVTARASANVGNLLQQWSRGDCSGATCSFRVTQADELSATFIPSRRLQLQQMGGVGGVRINGVSYALPVDEVLPRGTVVELLTEPAPDDVLLRIEGLPCETPRVIDECRFSLVDDVSGLVRFHRLFQWATGGSSAYFAGFVARDDGGVLVAVAGSHDIQVGGPSAYQTGEGLYSLDADAGLTLLERGSVRELSAVFQGMDGQLWLTAHPRAAVGESTISLWWGGFDAGVPVRNSTGTHTYFLRLDAQFQVDAMQIMPLSSSDGLMTMPGHEAPIFRETKMLSGLWWSGSYDGGISPSGIASWTADLELQSFEVQPSRLEDVAEVGGAVFSSSAAPVGGQFSASCAVGSDSRGVLARVDDEGRCVLAVGTGQSDGGAASRDSAIARGVATEVHLLESERYSLRLSAWTPSLQMMHSRAVEWLPVSAGESAGIPHRPMAFGDYVVGSIIVKHDGPMVLTAGETRVRCLGATRSQVLFRQRRSDGVIDWAVCLAGEDSGVRRFSGLQREFMTSLPAFGGVLTAEVATAARDAGTFHVGSSVLPSNGSRSLYFTLLTPPLAP